MYSHIAVLLCYRPKRYELMNHELKCQKWKPNQPFLLSRGSQVVLLQQQNADCYNPFPKIIFVLCFTFKVYSLYWCWVCHWLSKQKNSAQSWTEQKTERRYHLVFVRHRWQQSGCSNLRQYTVWRPTQSSDGWGSWLVLQRELQCYLSGLTFMHPGISNEVALVQRPRERQDAKRKQNILC